MNEERIDANIDEERVPNEVIVSEFPELVSNPFGLQLCRVFSSTEDKETMNFEDFLDMCSVLSPNAPIQTKADWAFRVFGEKLSKVKTRLNMLFTHKLPDKAGYRVMPKTMLSNVDANDKQW